MLAVHQSDYDKYGCPNCGCDIAIRDNFYCGGQQGVTCKHCDLHFVIVFDGAKQENLNVKYGFTRSNGKTIFETARLLNIHPRKGIIKWHYELPDIRPDIEDAEFFQSRGIGYDLAGFIKSKQAGERILEMVKEVLEVDEPKSWLDYRDFEPFHIQFKFKKDEFNLNALNIMILNNNNILTKDILKACKL